MDELFNIYWPENDFRYYLQHHGVQGQKWGVRNAEWYPIANYKAHLARMGGNPKGSKTSARVRASEGSSIIDRSSDTKKYYESKSFKKSKWLTLDDYKDIDAYLSRDEEVKYRQKTLRDAIKNGTDLNEEEKKFRYRANLNREKAESITLDKDFSKEDAKDFAYHYEVDARSNELFADLYKKEISEQHKKLLNSVKNYSSINLNKWGKSKDTNILYVTGTSGSGKSTIADELSKDGKVQVIHLDPYLGMMSQESRNLYQNKDFNKYLSKKVPEYRDVLNPEGKLNYKIVDKIAKASEDYGKEKFGKEKVIVEGVQLFDETFYANRDSYRNKPIVALKTNPILADFRGSKRDSENALETIELFAYRLPMSIKTYKTVENFEKDLELKVGKNLYKEITSTKISSYKDSDTNFKHSKQEREIAAKVKENGYSSLTEAEKKIYSKAYK